MPWFAPVDIDKKTSLEHWLTLDEETFRRLYRKTPFYRTKLAGMQRNAIVAAVNRGRIDLLEMIEKLCESQDQVLSSTAKWAVESLKSE
jgi:epoxyqueuosine reductase